MTESKREATHTEIAGAARQLSRDPAAQAHDLRGALKGLLNVYDEIRTAHPEAQGNKDLGEPAASGLEKAGHRLGSIRTPRMNGDNLAVVLCGYFDNPDQDADDECGWTPDAIAGCEEVLAAIRAHYQAALAAAPTSPQPINGEE